jgi:hypothetical protein
MSANHMHSPTSLKQAQSIIQELQTHGYTLLYALYTAFPFVEDAEDDPCFKPGHVKKTVRDIRSVIESVERAMMESGTSQPAASAGKEPM